MPQIKANPCVGVSRRVFIGGAPLTPALDGVLHRAWDPTSALCVAWLENAAEGDRLSRLWGDYEAQLNVQYGWYGLTESERENVAAGDELRRVEAELNRLTATGDALMEKIIQARATTRDVITLKLVVAAELIGPDNHPDVHRLISGVLGDLAQSGF